MTESEFLRKFLKDYKITRDELAEECGCSREFLGRLITRRSPLSESQKRMIQHGMKNLLFKKIYMYQEAEDEWSKWQL